MATKSEHPAVTLPVRVPILFWAGLILVQGIIYCLQPLWSAFAILLFVFLAAFAFAAITNTRWALSMVLMVALLVPMRLFMLGVGKSILFDISSLLILTLLLISLTVSAYRGERIIGATPLDGFLIALLILAVINSLFSVNTSHTIHAWQHIIIPGPIIFYLVHTHFRTAPQVRKAFKLIFAIMLITGVYLLVEHTLKFNPVYHSLLISRSHHYAPFATIYRTLGFCGHFNFTGVAFAFIIPFFIFGIQKASGLKRRLFWILATLIMILGLATTYSRTSILVLIIALILFSVRSWKIFLVTAGVLVMTMIVIVKANLFSFMQFRLNPRFLVNDPSLWHRLLMFDTCWRIFKDYPIFGAGLSSNFELYFQYKHPMDNLNYGVVDDQFLTFLCGTGTVGMIILLGLFARILAFIRRHNHKGQSVLIKYFRNVAIIGIIAFLLNSLNSDPLDWVYTNLLFWFVIALVIRLLQLPNSEMPKFFRLYGYEENSPQLQPIENPPK
jgi:O-antigen ligase